jgi:hypothetical protein
MDAHNQKKEELQKKPCYIDQILVAVTLTPLNQHQKFNPFKKDACKKKNAQAPSSPDQKILGFHPRKSSRSQNNAFDKVIARYNQ